MNDTHYKITEKIRAMMGKKTSEERLIMGCSMFDMSKRLVMSSIFHQTPNPPSSLLRREIFLRFYGNDFDSDTKDKIVKHLMRVTKI